MTQDTSSPNTVAAALERLHKAVLEVEGGWIPTVWTCSDGTAESSLQMSIGEAAFQQVGMFDEFELAAHGALTLRARLDLPETIHGVPISGEALQLTINSLRPVDIFHDGRRVFGDHLPVVASGPALIDVLPAIAPGENGELRIDVLATATPLDGQWATSGLTIHLTTPSVRERFRLLDLAHARLMLASSFAETEQQKASVLAAASLVPGTFTAMTTAALATALGDNNDMRGMSSHLRWLDEVLNSYRIHCVGHSHIDLAWLWTYDDTREVILRDMRSVLGLFDDYPEFRFTHSQARGYAEVEASEPQLFARIRDRIREGRLEPATMQWVEADANQPGGPAQARQLAEGVSYSQDNLGTRPQVFLAPDTFGHAGNLPQLASQAGATVYYHHRANPGFPSADRYWQAYWWVGDDGTRLLALATPVYLGPITATRLANDLIVLGKANGMTDICYFYGVGDHGGGPTREDLDAIRLLDRAAGFPLVRCATVSDYAAAVVDSGVALPEFHSESERVFEGCYITHADAKQLNRASENALVTAETLAAVAGIDAADELSTTWRSILHHQFHDILGGSAVAEAFDDQRRDTEEALASAKRITERALTILSGGSEPGTLVVTNPVAIDRRDLVRLPVRDRAEVTTVTTADGEPVASQLTESGELIFVAEVAGLASREYRLAHAPAAVSRFGELTVSEPDRAGNFVVDTPYWRAVVRGDAGIVVGLSSKSTGETLVGRGTISPESRRQMRPDLGLGALVLTHELPHEMTAWVADENDHERTLITGAETRLVESGGVRAVLETTHRFDSSEAVVRTIFYTELPWIDYELEVDWREVGTPKKGVPGLAISFGTRQLATALWTESPFGAVRRRPDGYLAPVLRWADLGSEDGGFTIANDAKYGVDALGPRLRMHVLRSAYDPDPRSDAGKRDLSRYRIHPHTGPWQDAGTIGLAAGLNQPLLAHLVAEDAAPAVVQPLRPRVESASIVLAGMLPFRHGGVLLRLYESQGKHAHAVLSGLGAEVATTDLLGRDVLQVHEPSEGRLELDMRPFEIRTLRLG